MREATLYAGMTSGVQSTAKAANFKVDSKRNSQDCDSDCEMSKTPVEPVYRNRTRIRITPLDYGYMLRIDGLTWAVEEASKLMEMVAASTEPRQMENGNTDSCGKESFPGREIEINKLNHGYTVEIGCQNFAIENREKMLTNLADYIANPGEVSQKWQYGKLEL